MNRAERRARAKKDKKTREKNVMNELDLYKWVDSLDNKKATFLKDYIEWTSEEKARKKSEEYVKHMHKIVDNCVSAALIESTEYSMEEIFKFNINAGKMIAEETDKNSNLMKREGKNYMSKVKKLQEEVLVECKTLIESGLIKTEIVKKLLFKFTDLSKSQALNAYKSVKEDLKTPNTTIISEEEATEKILNIMDSDNKSIKDDTTTSKQVNSKDITNVVKEIKKPVEGLKLKETTIKNIEKLVEDEKGPLDGIRVKKIEAVGRFAHYIAESKKVKFKLDRSFDKKSWESFKNEIEAMFSMMEGN